MPSKIIWEWWDNPLGGGSEWSDGPVRVKEDPGPYPEEKDDEEFPVRPVIMTDAGLIPISVYGDLFEAFEFWIGHTNFNLSEAIVNILKKVDGVESFDVLTRYRFRVSFGRCFDSSEVKQSIEKVAAAWSIE